MKQTVDHRLSIFSRFAEEGKARLISDLSNPLLMPPAVLLVVGLLLNQSLAVHLQVAGTAVVCYLLIPFLVTYLLFKKGIIESMDLPKRKSRTILYVCSLISAAAASFIIYYIIPDNHPFLFASSIVFLINLSIAFLINLRWKISIHSASVTVAGTIYSMLYFWGITDYAGITIILSFIHLLLLLPMSMWSRHQLSVHSWAELFSGVAAGVMLTIIELNLLKTLW